MRKQPLAVLKHTSVCAGNVDNYLTNEPGSVEMDRWSSLAGLSMRAARRRVRSTKAESRKCRRIIEAGFI